MYDAGETIVSPSCPDAHPREGWILGAPFRNLTRDSLWSAAYAAMNSFHMEAPPSIHLALTFDFDAMSGAIGSLGAKSPGQISRGEFGAVGAKRLLQLLSDLGLPATFFIPGHTALAFPRIVQSIAEAGHEICHHGWVHENPALVRPNEERRALERGLEALRDVVGVRPLGYRSPGWDHSPSTVELLLEYEFEYDSSLMASDYEPYWCRVGDRWPATEPYHYGRPVDLVELPVAWHLDDMPHFEFVFTTTLLTPGLHSPSTVLQVWRGEFDFLYREVGHGLLTLTMHPEVIGRGYRMLMLREFLSYVESHAGVTFTCCADYVRAWRTNRTPVLPDYASERAKPS